MLLPQSVPLLTDGAEPANSHILCYPHKDHWLVTRPLTINAEVDMFQELWIMLKFTDLLTKNVFLTVPMLLLHNNAKSKLHHAKSTKSLTTVSQRT